MALRKTLTAVGLVFLSQQVAALRKQDRTSSGWQTPIAEDQSRLTEAHEQRDLARQNLTLKDLQDELVHELGALTATLGISKPVNFKAQDTEADKDPNNPPVCHGECPMRELEAGTMVKPGGSTRCLKGADYKFQVFPGSSEKLYIHMQGGGCCWSQLTCVGVPTSQDNIWVTPRAGLYNSCGDSMFAGYTVVVAYDCSGDLYVGDIARPWQHMGTLVEQRGRRNFRAVIDWVKRNMAPKLSHLALTGESSGSVGLQLWARTLLTELQYKTAQVMTDSYVGVMPRSFQRKLFEDLHYCDSDLMRDQDLSLRTGCREGKVQLADVFTATMQAFPQVHFSTMSSKHDGSQILFHNAAALSMNMHLAEQDCGDKIPEACHLELSKSNFEDMIQPEGFHSRVLDIVEGYSYYHANFVSYIASGNSHCFLPQLGGTCPGYNYDVWESGAFVDQLQKTAMRGWAHEFFSQRLPKHSFCEKFNEFDDDDYCHPAQSRKTIGE